jgi:hypothetical protein
MRRRRLIGAVAACLTAAGTGAAAWEIARFTPSAVSPRLATPEQAVALRETQAAPLWWLRHPHRVAQARGWPGVPSADAVEALSMARSRSPSAALRQAPPRVE